MSSATQWVLFGIAVVVIQVVLLQFRDRLRARLFSRRHVHAEEMRVFGAGFAPLLLLEDVDPLQYWVTTWNEVTLHRWRRAVIIEQTALAARREPRALPRGA